MAEMTAMKSGALGRVPDVKDESEVLPLDAQLVQ
jgi:hypothetical protein